MFITNKRVVLPTNILYNTISIEVVPKFKLLGITLDSKLNFEDFVSGLYVAINKKMFAIKRIFYLSNSVRLFYLALISDYL